MSYIIVKSAFFFISFQKPVLHTGHFRIGFFAMEAMVKHLWQIE